MFPSAVDQPSFIRLALAFTICATLLLTPNEHLFVRDGISYVVETNLNRKYRTYRYGNPQFSSCEEARRILTIESILAEEFGLPRQK